MVFLITDGKPTDQPQKSVERWRKNYAGHSSMVVITLGKNADLQVLKQLTDNVLTLEGSTDEDFRKFIEWVSASVKAQSQQVKVEGKSSGVSLAKAGDAGLVVIEKLESYSLSDPDYVVLTGKCSKTRKPYLMKYAKIKSDGMERFIKTERFGLEGAYALDESYFDWSTEQLQQNTVNTSMLDGVPPCPVCGNPIAFALCECEHILCMDGSRLATCSWCNKKLKFDMNSGGGDFNVNRGQG